MDVRIGVTYSAKELEVELASDTDRDQVIKDVDTALAGSSSGAVLWLVDRRGRRVGIPADKIAYIDIGSAEEERRVGFGL